MWDINFVNRKWYHSMNVQVICDYEWRWINIVARWPGSAHDSRILRASNVWDTMENGGVRGYIPFDPTAVRDAPNKKVVSPYYGAYQLSYQIFCLRQNYILRENLIKNRISKRHCYGYVLLRNCSQNLLKLTFYVPN